MEELMWAEWTRIGPSMDGGADVDGERGGGLGCLQSGFCD